MLLTWIRLCSWLLFAILKDWKFKFRFELLLLRWLAGTGWLSNSKLDRLVWEYPLILLDIWRCFVLDLEAIGSLANGWVRVLLESEFVFQAKLLQEFFSVLLAIVAIQLVRAIFFVALHEVVEEIFYDFGGDLVVLGQVPNSWVHDRLPDAEIFLNLVQRNGS